LGLEAQPRLEAFSKAVSFPNEESWIILPRKVESYFSEVK
jgi:hypothetical protein